MGLKFYKSVAIDPERIVKLNADLAPIVKLQEDKGTVLRLDTDLRYLDWELLKEEVKPKSLAVGSIQGALGCTKLKLANKVNREIVTVGDWLLQAQSDKESYLPRMGDNGKTVLQHIVNRFLVQVLNYKPSQLVAIFEKHQQAEAARIAAENARWDDDIREAAFKKGWAGVVGRHPVLAADLLDAQEIRWGKRLQKELDLKQATLLGK